MTVQHRPAPGKYRLTVADFLRLDETGVFGTDRTELLDGDIIIMSAEHRPHAWVVGELGYRIRRALEKLGSDLYALGASIELSDHDVPLPDIVLTREPRGKGAIPVASVALVVEVSSSTLQRDLGDKVSIYARAGVPEYWVADVNGRVIHQMWAPAGEGYTGDRAVAFGEPMTAATLDGLAIDTDDL
ncbi:Uma2 family endonuclease [uncultured Sphingomonas sp.]|uniref:Uma2 family endonuclease n=1 Tax=uncultured Sphingomonas sp. TaxID=158754 RepID=UPI0035C954A2